MIAERSNVRGILGVFDALEAMSCWNMMRSPFERRQRNTSEETQVETRAERGVMLQLEGAS